MRAKITDGNRLILPDEVALALHGVEYLDIEEKLGCLVLTPVKRTAIDDIHDQMEKLGITEQDIADAVAWARKGGGPIAPGS